MKPASPGRRAFFHLASGCAAFLRQSIGRRAQAVPTAKTDKRTSPDDVRKSVRAALGAGADGVVLSREYVEMWLANLSAAGETLREVWGKA